MANLTKLVSGGQPGQKKARLTRLAARLAVRAQESAMCLCTPRTMRKGRMGERGTGEQAIMARQWPSRFTHSPPSFSRGDHYAETGPVQMSRMPTGKGNGDDSPRRRGCRRDTPDDISMDRAREGAFAPHRQWAVARLQRVTFSVRHDAKRAKRRRSRGHRLKEPEKVRSSPR
jgi:hypothetical protein